MCTNECKLLRFKTTKMYQGKIRVSALAKLKTTCFDGKSEAQQ